MVLERSENSTQARPVNTGNVLRKEHKLAATVIAVFLAAAGILSAESICEPARALKPVRCVCGTMIDQAGGPAADVTLHVIKDGEIVGTTATSHDGKFAFSELQAGKYELRAEGFEPMRSSIVVVRPTAKCTHGMRIMLVLSYPDNCGSYVIKQ